MFDIDIIGEELRDRKLPLNQPLNEAVNAPQQLISCYSKPRNHDQIETPMRYKRDIWADCKSEVFQKFKVCKIHHR